MLLPLYSCFRSGPTQQTYARAWAAFAAGDLQEAGREASPYATRAQQDPNSYWGWNLRLLYAEVLNAQSQWTPAHDLLLVPLPAKPEFRQLEAQRLIQLALTDLQIGEAANAPNLLAQARSAAADPEVLIRLDMAEGVAALSRRQAEAARQSFSSAADRAARKGLPYWQSLALNNLCYTLKRLGRYDESVEAGRRSLTAADRLRARRLAGMAHNNLGSVYAILGDFDNAVEHERQAVATFEAIGARLNLAMALGELGLAYDGAGDFANAAASYRKAYDLSLALNRPADVARHAENLALTLIKAHDWNQAAAWNQRFYEQARKIEANDALPYAERNRALIAENRGDPATAARICRNLLRVGDTPLRIRWEALALLGDTAADAKDYAAANRAFEQALGIIETTRSDLLDPDYRITLLSELIPFYRDYVDVLWRQKDDARALRVVESSRARVLAERLERDVKAAPPAGLPRLERLARDAHASILSYWLAPDRSFAWLISSGGIRRFEMPGSDAIAKLVTVYRDTVEHSVRDPLRNATGCDLWQMLIAPVAPYLRKGERLIVIPDGALHRLNLETLIAPAPRPHYWIEDVEIAISPSLAILALPTRHGEESPASLLLIGAPDYSGTRYQALANAAREVRDIQADFSGRTNQTYLGAQATPAVYSGAEPSRFSLIHFAAHAEANEQRPLESAVILTHGKLYARDVASIPIHAGLVTISACSSAGTRAYAGEGLVGFAWAFLEAGARAVAAGLWDVSDSSTEELMNEFYKRMAAGADPVAAIRQAKLALLASSHFNRPYYWAPFQIYVASTGR